MPDENQKITAQYEAVGARAVRAIRTMEADPKYVPEFIEGRRRFIKKYEQAPLFVIGVDGPSMDSIIEELKGSGSVFENFRLPYPTMVLDFPTGPLANDAIPCLMFVDTLGPDRYYIEVLRTAEAQQKRVQSLTVIDRSILESHPGAVDMSDGVAEIVAAILTIDRVDPDRSHYALNADYIHDCQIEVTPDFGVSGFCNFSTCKRMFCQGETTWCKSLDSTANYALLILSVAIAYINRPDRFVLKVTPEKTEREKRQAEKGRVPCFTKKETYIVLDHSQVREIIDASGAGGGTHSSPLPHQRRGHWRELRADRYHEKKKVWVRPADINKGMTVVVKKAVYQVVS